jgi:uncharacterized double-CXXCG motif protein
MPWSLMAQRSAVEALQKEGVRGIRGLPMQLRFKGKSPPELLDLEIAAHGQLLPDCLQAGRPPPCQRCGREGASLPDSPILDSASLPRAVDLFRLRDFTTVIVVSERFVQAVRRLGLDEVVFNELPVR